MLYTELAKIGFSDMTLSSVASDIVNNARWSYTKAAFKKALLTEHEIGQLKFWAIKANIVLPVDFTNTQN